MFLDQQQLRHGVDFDNAIYTGTPVSIWRHDQYIDYGGRMTKHDDEAAYIEGSYFLKREFVFVVRLDR